MEFDFDDSVFVSKTRSTTGDKLRSYNAKICSPLWFEDELSNVESDLTQLLFSADYHYSLCHYQKAMEKYTQLLEMFPESGRSKRRDLLESLARCHLKLDNPDNALQYTKLLSEHASNDDHEVQTLSLFHEIYQKQQHFADDVVVLQKLIGFHPHHYMYWFNLAQAYKGMKNKSNAGSNNQANCDRMFSCYLRTRVLLQFSLKFSGAMMEPKLKEMFKQVSDQLVLFDVSAENRLQAEKHLCKDLPNEIKHMVKSPSEEEGDKEDPVRNVVHIQNKLPFEQRWFSWRDSDLLEKEPS